ncbi:dihydroorotase [candidate division NPL-UPA2 bacterium Unc8]|uniref:Dihydroorotase n=1 Tax=candidate division NPL-UPA2 bacterium Unc8 TaxID=1980939 RepID=A0A399FVQ1_UNCN2|nr:Dihydroorotase [Bacillota bacterium]MBT9137858.1 Dihydroorotase [Bacillota bacterium]MBT9146471.1 Dihydroorotase [Bacillota bacterium]RII00211.1 MAG: dihydroorotase [candidate division NPL-UPA2 bacterium Unc8]
MKLLLKGGRVIDPSRGVNRVSDILIDRGRIAEIGRNIPHKGERVIDVKGKIVSPGLIDMHVHLREPGNEEAETIETGTRAAARGGFVLLACMPNTNPTIDNQDTVAFIHSMTKKKGAARVLPIGSITKGLEGKELAEMGELKGSGVVAVSDDGGVIHNCDIMRHALEYAKMLELLVISHCEDETLNIDGVMNEGYWATSLGLAGTPTASEEIAVARNIRLLELSGGALHIAHLSCAGSVSLVREAKKRGINVTCETAPHYFTLTDEAIKEYNTNTKVKPPLRGKKDVEAIKEGLSDGTIDVIATDHAPHTPEEKEVEYELAPFGMIGLETALPLILGLTREGVLDLNEALAKITNNPARILNLDGGTLKVGSTADITVIDLEEKVIVKKDSFQSKSRNSPFIGWELQGMAVLTICGGKITSMSDQVKNKLCGRTK